MDAELIRRISTALDGLEKRLKTMPAGENTSAVASTSDATVQFLQNENQTLRRRQDEVKARLDALIGNVNSQLKA